MTTWAIVPFKNLSHGKSRLSTVLDPMQRGAMAMAMLQDVFAALQRCQQIDHLLLVSDASFATNFSQSNGTECFSPNAGGGSDLNGDLSLACEYAYQQGARACVVVHADLPLLAPESVDKLIRSAESDAILHGGSTLAISPSEKVLGKLSQGSNLLYASLPLPVRLVYGEGSFTAFQNQADENGCHCRVASVVGADLDVDIAQDLDTLQKRLSVMPHDVAPATRRTLLGFEGIGIITKSRSLPSTRFDQQVVQSSNEGIQGFLGEKGLDDEQALALAERRDTAELMAQSRALTTAGFGQQITYSRKVFIPLTRLCRDVCHYCTFATTPKQLEAPYMTVEEAVAVARRGAELGCKEVLLTLGEKPELRYSAAKNWLAENGFATTLEYVAHIAKAIREETGLLPHINAGNMNAEEIAMLRPAAHSMGIMLESISERLCEKGMPHYGSPDKMPAARLQTLELAGQAKVPFTTGILIGIGETRRERIESLLALRQLHIRYGHIQEIIVQNFRAKHDTKMANAAEPELEDLCWTIAVTRLIFGPQMSIQVPPNLSEPDQLAALIKSGINDWGGVSPLTPDYVNPEAPWPHLDKLAAITAENGRTLVQRLTVYPQFIAGKSDWIDSALHASVLRLADGQGLAREDDWLAGTSKMLPRWVCEEGQGKRKEGQIGKTTVAVSSGVAKALSMARAGKALGEAEIVELFRARGADYHAVSELADELRRDSVGESVTYAVNRNINYTNICYFKCGFCAFSKGNNRTGSRENPYNMGVAEIVRRTEEAWQRGATEVCLQGGIHPEYNGQTYLDILTAIRNRLPDLHIHAFSPLEVWQGAATLGIPLRDFLRLLKAEGLNTLPGTAAEILDDEVRKQICPDKLNTEEWLEVMRTAHDVGLKTTATIMFGHVDGYHHWARHLIRVRELQAQTGGFTEFVPLPFVAAEAPMYRRGLSRQGPTLRESVLMHAVARLVLYPVLTNIQTSWVKMGAAGASLCLQTGANDLGGVLMNESITRAAGADHGQEFGREKMLGIVELLNRPLAQRDTLYRPVEGAFEFSQAAG